MKKSLPTLQVLRRIRRQRKRLSGRHDRWMLQARARNSWLDEGPRERIYRYKLTEKVLAGLLVEDRARRRR